MSSSSPKRHPPGTTLGSYRLDDVIGEGSMGIVYLATHARLGRRVAIKILRHEYADNPLALRRFFDEARAVNKISHPNVLEVTDFVERPGQDNYYVMELLEGVNLAELVEAGGMLELPRTVPIMTQLAKALEAVHDAGIVHRDVKPYNVILINREGNQDFVKLVDFGIAQLSGEDGKLARDRSDTATVVGTRRYMSPEQTTGAAVDRRSDIYSFGAMLYELVTGRPPIVVSTDFRIFTETLRTVPPTRPRDCDNLPHDIPVALDELIMRCLAKAPGERPARMDVVADKLVAIADEEGWLVYELSAVPRASSSPVLPAPRVEPSPPPRSRRGRWIVAALLGTAVIGTSVVMLSRSASAPHRDPVAERHAQLEAELAVADQRVAAGRLVGAGNDEALDHLLKARAIDPDDPRVKQRLDQLARTFERLAQEARAAGSLAEAAAHLEAVLAIEPTNPSATAQLKEIEQQVLDQQRAKTP